MPNNRFFLYVFLAMGQSTLAMQAPCAASPLDLVYDAKRSQDYADITSMIIDKRSCVQRSNGRAPCRENAAMQISVVQSFNQAMRQSKGDCNNYGFSNVQRQSTSNLISFYTSINGQLSSKNFDFLKDIEPDSGNVVSVNQGSAVYMDQGYVLNLEARMRLPEILERQVGELQLIGFVDTAAMTEKINTWVDGINPRALTGSGIGFNYIYTNKFEVKAYLAHKPGNDIALFAQDPSSRIWIQALKYF